MLRDYKNQMDTPKRQKRLSLVFVEATIDSSGDATTVTADSSPDTTLTKTATGTYRCNMPRGTFQHFVGGSVVGPSGESAGSQVYPETKDAGAGTATIETSITPGTAADPADGSRIVLTYLVGGP